MKILAAGLALAIAVLAGTTALADERAKDAEALMREYLSLWNAHDAAAITSRIYRFDAPNSMSTVAGLQSQFDQLKAQGYDRSEAASIEGCLIAANVAMVQLRYSRLKADGTPLPPRDRATLYMLRKFDDGWRITQLITMDPTAKLTCASATG